MLTILNDPSGITGGERHTLDYTVSMQENITRHLAAGGGCELRINGIVVDPLTDPRLDFPPGRGDLVTVTRRPEGYEAIYYLVLLALVVYTYATMPNIPDGESTGKDSPNNKLTGQSNVARAYQGIPDVYGHRRVWPDLIQPSTVEYVDNVKMVTEWLCVSRGTGTIVDIQYAETAIGDISGASYEIFQPEPGVDGYAENGTVTMNDVYEAFASDEVNGQELPYAVDDAEIGATADLNAVLAATTFTLTLADGSSLDDLKALSGSGSAEVVFFYALGTIPFSETCAVISYLVAGPNVTFTFGSSAWASNESEAGIAVSITPLHTSYGVVGPFTLPVESERIWWNTVFLRGLKGTVWIRATWWQVDGDGDEIGGTRETDDYSYSSSSYDQRYYTNKVTPAAGDGRYQIQFERLSGQVDAQGTDVAKLEEVYAVRYTANKVLPGVTVIRVTTRATISATGFSDRKFNLRWTRQVRTLIDDAQGPSRNFARAIAHIWSLAGNDVAGLDLDALIAINDEHGETSPLLRFDGSLDDADMSLGDRMQMVANMARCVLWRDGTKWTATRDQARDTPDMQLDYRNLAASGESTINYASHLPASFDGVEVEYVDETTQATKAYIRLDINSGTPVEGASGNPKKIKMPGCTTTAQAENRAQLEARRLIYQRTSVNDTALSDASGLGLLGLVRWVDPNDFAGDDGLQAGEVLSIAGLVITTSEPIDWKGETSGRILFTGEDGRQLGAPIVCYPSGSAVQLASVPAGLYVSDEDRQLGSRYAFGVGLTESELEASGLYSATEIRPAADGTVTLALAQYDARMYDYD